MAAVKELCCEAGTEVSDLVIIGLLILVRKHTEKIKIGNKFILKKLRPLEKMCVNI